MQNATYKNMHSPPMSTGDACRKQRPQNATELANQPGNANKHVDKTEELNEAGDKPATGGGVKAKKEIAITEEFFAQQFQDVTSDHVR